jgi:hypothetical protein
MRPWDYYFLNMAPAHLQGSPAFHLEHQTLMAELGCIRRDVPPEVMAATAAQRSPTVTRLC